jgi:uncharacterized membrane protein
MKRNTTFYRMIGCMTAVAMTVSACAVGPSVPLTPAQQRLYDANRRFAQTVNEGAIIGMIAGAALGAALGGSKSGAQLALVGAAAGGALGSAAGYAVARSNYAHAQTEDNLQKAIAEANEDAAAYQRSAAASEEIAAEARAQVAELNAKYQQKTITAAQLNANIAGYRQSAEIMRKQIGDMDSGKESLRADARTAAGPNAQIMLAKAREIEAARAKESRSLDQLEQLFSSIPAG